MKRLISFGVAAVATIAFSAPSLAATDLSGYTPTVGQGVTYGKHTKSATLQVSTIQKLVCGLTLSQASLNFGRQDYNSYDGILGDTIKGNQTVYGTVACNDKTVQPTVSVLDNNGRNTVGYEQLTGPSGEDDSNVVLNYELTAAGANATNAGPQTLTLSQLVSSGVNNIYKGDFQVAVQALAHITQEGVYHGKYTGAITIQIANEKI